ncbi:MAG: hypothetical protein ACXWMV_07730 [Syntrophales bacterium]
MLLRYIKDEGDKVALKTFAENVQTLLNKPMLSYGVNCWHKSEHESEAMWRLYSVSGHGIAIESTIGQLKASLPNRPGLIVESVQYVDFDKDFIPKTMESGQLFAFLLKRKSFEHEKVLRAAIPLPEEGKGTLVECNLDTLISRIHISPSAPAYFREVLENLCAGKVRNLEKPVVQSRMFNAPDYSVKINTEI